MHQWKGFHVYYNIETQFFQKSSKLNFDLCRRPEINIQLGLSMHLYDDIGDASLSLRGSTSSFQCCLFQLHRIETNRTVYSIRCRLKVLSTSQFLSVQCVTDLFSGFSSALLLVFKLLQFSQRVSVTYPFTKKCAMY